MKTFNHLNSEEASMVLSHFTLNFNLKALNDLFEIAYRNVRDRQTRNQLALLTEKSHSMIIDFILEHRDKFDAKFIEDLTPILDLDSYGNKKTDLGCNLADS